MFFLVNTITYSAAGPTEEYHEFSFKVAQVHHQGQEPAYRLVQTGMDQSHLKLCLYKLRICPRKSKKLSDKKHKTYHLRNAYLNIHNNIYSHSFPASICSSYKNDINPSLHTLVNSKLWEQFRLQQRGTHISGKGI